jgi:hypothetical protein
VLSFPEPKLVQVRFSLRKEKSADRLAQDRLVRSADLASLLRHAKAIPES